MMAVLARILRRAVIVRYVILFYVLYGVIAAPACRSLEASPDEVNTISADREWEEWDVLDSRLGVPVKFDQWLDSLSGYDIVYVGEEHHNRFHIEAALKILRSLVDRNQHPTLGLEMFGWDGQTAVDRYVR